MPAFTEEQTKEISGIIATALQAANDKAAADKKAAEDAAKNNGGGTPEAKTTAQEAKEKLDAENAAAAALATIQDSVKFNLSLKDFFDKNKSLLPDEAGKILEIIAAKTFKDDNEKANTTRKDLLDAFLSKQENIDVLTPSLKDRAEKYKALAESDKLKRSSEFWDLAETGLALKLGARKADALNKINGGNAGESSKNPLEDKILAAANKKFNNETK